MNQDQGEQPYSFLFKQLRALAGASSNQDYILHTNYMIQYNFSHQILSFKNLQLQSVPHLV